MLASSLIVGRGRLHRCLRNSEAALGVSSSSAGTIRQS